MVQTTKFQRAPAVRGAGGRRTPPSGWRWVIGILQCVTVGVALFKSAGEGGQTVQGSYLTVKPESLLVNDV